MQGVDFEFEELLATEAIGLTLQGLDFGNRSRACGKK